MSEEVLVESKTELEERFPEITRDAFALPF